MEVGELEKTPDKAERTSYVFYAVFRVSQETDGNPQ